MDDLNKRIVELMVKIGVSKTNFANDINVSQAVITHLTSGRNKPGVEILQKILQRYPKISAEWLLLGQGPMFKTEAIDKAKIQQALQLAETRLQNSIFDLKTVNDIIQEQKESLK